MFGMTTTTNLSLLESMRGGRDQRAWREFFHAYAPMLAGFARRLGLSDADANDAVQETLLAVHAAFRKMDGPFDRGKGRFKSWLRGIAQNKVRDVHRRRAREERARARHAAEQANSPGDTAEMDEAFESEWQRRLLGRALEAVSREVDPAVYQAFELYAVLGQPADKVARLLGTTRNAVYISKTRVLRRLRAVLARLMEEEG